MEAPFQPSLSCGLKRWKRLLLGVHSLSGQFAFSALTRLQQCIYIMDVYIYIYIYVYIYIIAKNLTLTF